MRIRWRPFDKTPRLDREELLAIARALAHRGPDGEGIWEAPWLCLAHRRLSIIGLSEASSQPMLDPQGRYVLVFNGQIYNYRELADQFLGDDSYVSRRSDTSVLLRMYVKFGPDCLQHLNGTFAFVIADLQRKTLFLARDRCLPRRRPPGRALAPAACAVVRPTVLPEAE